MKIRYITAIMTSILLSVTSLTAQTEVRDNVQGVLTPFTVSAGQTIQLNITGDIQINSDTPFTIQDGGTLIINNIAAGSVTISNSYTNANGRGEMFLVYSKGKLTINGGESKGITIDGGSALSGSPGSYAPTVANRHFNNSLIRTIGTLNIDNVTIRNFYSDAVDSGTIEIDPSIYPLNSSETCGKTTISNCIVENCRSQMGTFMFIGNSNNYLSSSLTAEACRIDVINTIVRNCEMACDSNGWGGAIRCRGGSMNNLYLTNTVFSGNYSRGDGSTLWWNAGGRSDTRCIIDGCRFIDNIAERDAGALRLEGTFEFSGGKTVVSGNRCNGVNHFAALNRVVGNGGGIQIYGYAGTADAIGGELTYSLPECLEVTGNSAASYGGGIAFEFNTDKLTAGTKIYAEFNGMLVDGNQAGLQGGGVYMINDTNPEKKYSFDVNLNAGTIQNNTALNGGGMYICKLNLNSKDDGSLLIKGNTAEEYGGGVYVYNDGLESANKKNVTLTSGTISHNTGRYGGGLAAYGNLTIVMDNISIESNSAINGGGLFAYGMQSGSGAVVHYKSGLIRYNKATSTETIETAYGPTDAVDNHKNISGIGGGIYMGRFTHLDFKDPDLNSTPQAVGIYSNRASNGADDLFGYNQNVYLELPNVKSLNLSGFNEQMVDKLYWVEDYVSNDTHYADGLKLKGTEWDSDRTNQRYRDVIEEKVSGKYYAVDFNGASILAPSKYLCLAIGWHINRITLIKEGMKDGENAIFTIYKDGEEYMTVMMTDGDKKEDGKRYKVIELKSDGTYRITETAWSWAYDVSGSNEITREINISTSDSDRIFTFTNLFKDDSPMHKEDLEINRIIIPN